MKRIYLDYASLTPIDRRVSRVMQEYSGPKYANPSSWHREGVAAKKIATNSRKTIADLIHGHGDEIIFTSGGTESNNLAILGAIESAHSAGAEYSSLKVVTSTIEHSSVLEACRSLAAKGVKVEYVHSDNKGRVDLEELEKAINPGMAIGPETTIVSIMMANNELGTVQPIKEIAKIIRRAKKDQDSRYPLFHTDASQAVAMNELDMNKLGVDMLTLDGGKIYGPRGVGILFVRRGTPIKPLIVGGGQENGMRSGTEDVASIAGLAKALELVCDGLGREQERIASLKDRFVSRLKGSGLNVVVNSSSGNIVNLSIPGVDNEFFLFELDANGIACSTKSSCLNDEDESYVLKEIGADPKTSLRFSFGRWTGKREVDRAAKIIGRLLNSHNVNLQKN